MKDLPIIFSEKKKMIELKSKDTAIKIFPVTNGVVDNYLKNDVVKKDLKILQKNNKYNFHGDKWLLDSKPKRYIFFKFYYDLFNKSGINVLDVGGGMTLFWKKMAQNNSYSLIELMNHENIRDVKSFVKNNKIRWIDKSWYEIKPTNKFDFVIANDLFPNVDQRLDLFVKRYLPACREMRLSISTYDEGKFYKVRRFDEDEILFIKPWTRKDFISWFNDFFKLDLKSKRIYRSDIYRYPNGRSVVLLKIIKKITK